MKNAGIIVLTVLIAFAASSSAKSASWGKTHIYYQSFTTIFTKSVFNKSLTGIETKQYLKFPEYPNINCEKIMGIMAFDNNYGDESKSNVTLIAGGLGKRDVTLEFTSSGLVPLDYTVHIYGLKDEADLNMQFIN